MSIGNLQPLFSQLEWWLVNMCHIMVRLQKSSHKIPAVVDYMYHI